MIKSKILTLLVLCLPLFVNAQGYLHADGKDIVDGAGENFILRSIGTGNWMIQEGYMMRTGGVAGTQHEFRAKLEESIGEANTDVFYETWLNNHMTRTDIDSMKAWGFNSVRAALHYLWFTPPIEDEPVLGEITWIEDGFNRVDSLLDWCADNEMYLILDMHGTPGGQGKNADISDYDPSKPSLWESDDNKRKLVALWKELAERYSSETWIGGYDMINETNWDFENSGNENGVNCQLNIPLLELHKRIIDTIRTVDNNHLVFVSGNSWGNNYNGMNSLASYDDNLSYTFHKYWNYNDEGSISGFLDMRENLDVPLWMSESGENSNTWFTNAISLFENNNIGWSWWPVKKGSINNVLEVKVPGSYDTLVKVWKNELSLTLTPEETFDAALDWAESHKIENCIVKYDVIDAMIRQPKTTEVLPFKEHSLGNSIFFSDYDLGRNNYAYYDTDTADYHSAGQDYTSWNAGWGYRSDGVDIEPCTDTEENTNGYNVGWTADGEWLQYTLKTDSVAAYSLTVRSASGGSGSKFHFEVNDINVTDVLDLPGTSDWQNWETSTFEDIIIPAGDVIIKFKMDQGGSNLSFFNFTNPKSIDGIEYKIMSASTSVDGSQIYVGLNKEITTADADLVLSDFEFMVNGEIVELTSISINSENKYMLVFTNETPIYSDNELTLSYSGTSIKNGSQNLSTFSNQEIENNLITSHPLPGRIQAEDFLINNGLSLEECDEGGYNTGYANAGDYLIYKVHVTAGGEYQAYFRVATTQSTSRLAFQIGDGDNFTSLDTIKFSSTGGWQEWETQRSNTISLEEGYYYVKLLIISGEHNLNWFEIAEPSSIGNTKAFADNYLLYPNPADDYTLLKVKNDDQQFRTIRVYDINGRAMSALEGFESEFSINTANYPSGMYFLQVKSNSNIYLEKLIIK